MTVKPELWARVSGVGAEQVAGNLAAYLERQIAGLELVVETGASVVARAANVTPPPTHKAQTRIDGEGQ